MKSRMSMRWLAWPAIAAVMALVAFMASSGEVANAQPCGGAQPCNEIAVVGPAASVAVGTEFNVNIDFTAADTPYQGYKAWLQWTDTIVNYVTPPGVTYTGLGGMNLDSAPTEKDVAPANGTTDGVQFGSGRGAGGTSQMLGTAATARLVCAGPGVSPLHLVTPAEGGAFGTKMLAPGGVGIATTLVDGSVTCEYMADLWIFKTHAPASPVADSNLVYTITVINEGPNSAYAVSVADSLPLNKTYVSDTSPYGCVLFQAPATYVCPITDPMNPMDTMDPAEVAVFTITVHVELADAGKLNINGVIVNSINPMTLMPVTKDPNVPAPGVILTQPQFYNCLGLPPGPYAPWQRLGDVNPVNPAATRCDNVWADQTQVQPAGLTITKSGPAQMLTGQEFKDAVDGPYIITLHSDGPSPATEVQVTDTIPGGVTFDGVTASCDTAAITCSEASGVVTCDIPGPMPVSETCTITIDATCAAAGTVVNKAHVTWHDGATGDLGKDSNEVTTVQLPPFNGMVKDCDLEEAGIQDACNLWLCKAGPDCHLVDPIAGAQIGKGALDVADYIFLREDSDSPNDSDTDPEGLAAYEEQLKYDHKIFDVVVADAGDDGLDNDGDCGTDDTNGNGVPCDCALVGSVLVCDYNVDEPDESVIEGPRGNINCSMTIMTENWIMFGCVSAGQELGNPMPVGLWLKTISLTPDPDMFQRMRPTKDNGVVSNLLDENCEVADIYASEPWPFTLPGGLTEDCTDLTVTVRMLEGDINLDCMVNALDEQMIAQRYGTFFGLLLYNSFYDLEPKLTDFDIDIKDVQFVFGRDGSMCQDPIPNQFPEPAIPDP